MSETVTQTGTRIDQLSSGDQLKSSNIARCEEEAHVALEEGQDHSGLVISTHCPDGAKGGLHLIYDPHAVSQSEEIDSLAVVDIGINSTTVRQTGLGLTVEDVISSNEEITNSAADAWLDELLFEESTDKLEIEDHDGEELTIKLRSPWEGAQATVIAKIV